MSYTTNYKEVHSMSSGTFTVRVDSALKKRLEKLAKSTGRSRSFLAAEAIGEYVDVNEGQVAGIKRAMQSADRIGAVPHEEVKKWVRSWGSRKERPRPKPGKA
jgi:predicted transcriptional regulator